MQNAPTPTESTVPLSHKRVPTEELSLEEEQGITCAALLGSVDITKLRSKVVSLEEERWTDSYNGAHNVSLERPFHDRIGVNKIICIFSDTKLDNVFYLPAWGEWKELVMGIFDEIGIEISQVVRCLFARMPPGTIIPAHHDNGPWVSQTHRVHVPIVTHEDVTFKSGPKVESMQRFAFNEGSIVELNNAAKHSVENASDVFRVHLIFDYVEPDRCQLIQKPIVLRAGQKCQQVRGRVKVLSEEDTMEDSELKKDRKSQAWKLLNETADMAKDAEKERWMQSCRQYFIEQMDSEKFLQIFLNVFEESVYEQARDKCAEMFRCIDELMEQEFLIEFSQHKQRTQWKVPSFIIIGAQKSGTTAMYQYIAQHSKAVKGKRREPHFFDWFWQVAEKTELTSIQKKECESVMQKLHSYQNDGLDHMRMKYLLSLQYPLQELHKPTVIGESTPSYLLYGDKIARRVQQLCPTVRLIVMLRDPVSRAYSHFQMTSDETGTAQQLESRKVVKGMSFEELINQDLDLLNKAGVTPEVSSEVFQCEYADKLPMTHGCHSYIGRGLYAFQLEQWFKVFPLEHKQILILSLEDMKVNRSDGQEYDGVVTETRKVFEFLGLEMEQIQDREAKNTRKYEAMHPAIQERLREFYRPYNERLYRLLRRNFGWK